MLMLAFRIPNPVVTSVTWPMIPPAPAARVKLIPVVAPPEDTVTRSAELNVALPPLASDPTLHVTLLVPLQLPWDADAETKLTPIGSVSVTTTPVAVFGPLLVTVIVYVIVAPTVAGSADAVFVTER